MAYDKYAAPRSSVCKHCQRNKKEQPEGSPPTLIDYKNVRLLQKMSTPQGKLYGRKRSGLCAGCQRVLKNAVKRARFMATLMYVGH